VAESWESIERAAAGAIDGVADARWCAQEGEKQLPQRWPDAAALTRVARELAEVDRGRAALVGEAAIWMALRAPWARYRAAMAAKGAAVRLRADDVEVPWAALPGAVACEPSRARRELLWAAGDGVAIDLRDEARDVVAALRDATAALGGGLCDALGMGDVDDDAGAVLDATDDAFGELDAWAARQAELDPARLTWPDRLHLGVCPALLRELPPASLGTLGTGWLAGVGLEAAQRAIVDGRRPASDHAEGVEAWVTDPGRRAIVLGRPRLLGYDAGEVLGALTVCVAGVVGGGLSPGQKRGAHRVLDGAAHALGRGLLVEPAFLQRHGGLSGAARERALRAALHAELARVRWDAAMARFTAAAMRREPGMAERFVAEVTRALGAAPSPAWAVHLVARAMEPGGAWPGRSAGRVAGLWCAIATRQRLRERCDEDWFRNPRAGALLRGAWDELRAVGPTRDVAAERAEFGRWLADAMKQSG
jgi:hypothetical protein